MTTSTIQRTSVQPALAASHLTKTYGTGDTAVRPLNDLSVQVPAATFTAIMGPSGSGKSTLMHVLAGLDTAESGTVQLATDAGLVELMQLDERRLTRVRREHVGFIFQAFNLVPAMTARENILLPSTLGGPAPEKGALERIAEELGLADRLGHRPHELSGGQQQRVAVARALVSRPAVIFADEPTGNLDSTASAEVLRLLRSAVDQYQQTVVMVTHDASAAAEADRVVILSDGRVVDVVERPSAEALAARMLEVRS
ncbi:ABC transporter ATP-binding protein [Nesterenkonia sp. NBAIMH1]|uniref:ABC transporter ATP-binding protein n=1 Tax=Nesterenkonia sp. NBAIMH1 TaxID=2600320 RepID=UPI0011B3FE8F|nr:ABC transporter ATP-binding protein [Nesterenkonia sp. NBAIMH1]